MRIRVEVANMHLVVDMFCFVIFKVDLFCTASQRLHLEFNAS